MGRQRRRATALRTRARVRARYLLSRSGQALREARRRQGLTQAAAAERAGCSQPYWSRLERGAAPAASVETLAAAAYALGTEVAAFIEAVSGADLPRDIEHIRRQDLVVRVAQPGGWRAIPELGVDPGASRSRAIDVFLERPTSRECAVVEVVDLIDDVGAIFRGLTDKVAAVGRARPGWAIRGLIVVRATRRNRGLIAELRATFGTRFQASSRDWLEALRNIDHRMPDADGLVWSSVRGDRLFARRELT